MGEATIARRSGNRTVSIPGWRSSAAGRIAVLIAGLMFAVMIVLGGAAVAVTYTIMADRLDRSIRQAADGMMTIHDRQGPSALIRVICQRERVESDSIDAAIFARDGRPLAGRRDIPLPPDGWSDRVFPDPVEGGDPTRVFVRPLEGGARLMIVGNRRPLLIARSAIGWLFVASVVIVMMVCAMVGVVLARYLDRRLSPITGTAAAIVDGELSRRVPENGQDDEFDRVARSLNLMLDRIAGLMTNLRQISSDLAHDLRTPLTRIRAGLEVAASVGPERTADAVRIAIAQIDDVVLMFEAILRIAEIDGAGGHDRSLIDLNAVARDIVETMASAFADQAIGLVYRDAPACVIRGDRLQIAAALINLLENVLRHAPGSHRADVVVERCGDRVAMTVHDTGPGVLAAQLDRIFDRFVRLDHARSGSGHGLGLSVVRSVAQAHGARVTATNTDDGLAIRIDFPAAAPID